MNEKFQVDSGRGAHLSGLKVDDFTHAEKKKE